MVKNLVIKKHIVSHLGSQTRENSCWAFALNTSMTMFAENQIALINTYATYFTVLSMEIKHFPKIIDYFVIFSH